MTELTTTSYAILGLLNLRPHSAYDLTQQARRSLRFIWPTSESQLYAEPKRLAREGLIRTTEERGSGERTRRVHRITPAGRRALRAWLATTPSAPHIESEMLLRVLFGDAADKTTLLDALRASRAQTQAEYDAGIALVRDALEEDAPYPERLHVNTLWWVLVSEFLRLTLDWFDFAEREVASWPATSGPRSQRRARSVAQRLLDAEAIVQRGRSPR